MIRSTLAGTLWLAATGTSETIHVYPWQGPHPIQLALDGAVDGDTLVLHGDFFDQYPVSTSKSITITGQLNPDGDFTTFIRGFAGGQKAFAFFNCSNLSIRNLWIAYGGISVSNCTAQIENVYVSYNDYFPFSQNNGGAVEITNSNVVLEDSLLQKCSASRGGGIYTENSNITIRDCRIVGNESQFNGSGIYSVNSVMDIIGSTVVENQPMNDFGGAGGGIYVESGSLALRETPSRICDNVPTQISGKWTNPENLNHCIDQFCFSDSDNDGCWDLDSDCDYVLDCYDMCPGEDDQIDLNQNSVPDCLECIGDLDSSSAVDYPDLITLISNWGTCEPPCPSDIVADGVVGYEDLLQVLAAWGPCSG